MIIFTILYYSPTPLKIGWLLHLEGQFHLHRLELVL